MTGFGGKLPLVREASAGGTNARCWLLGDQEPPVSYRLKIRGQFGARQRYLDCMPLFAFRVRA